MTDVRTAARELVNTALERRVNFPKIWDEHKRLQTCGTILLSFRNDTSFDSRAALKALISTYGQESPTPAPAAAAAATTTTTTTTAAASSSSPAAAVTTTTTTTTTTTGAAADGNGELASPSEKKRKAEDTEEVGSPTKETKKVKKVATFLCERNRAVGLAIKEMGDVYYKNKDIRKGGVFSKAAKSIRECESYIDCAKTAMKLNGIGKGIANYIQEHIDTGMIVKLEELRAGEA